MNRLIIIGASGHGKVVADIARLNGYEDIVFLDDDGDIRECAGWPVIGKSIEAPEGDVFVAVGNAEIRKRLMKLYQNRKQPVLIHPSSIVAQIVEIGSGTVVMAGTVFNPDARIGKGCIINTSSSVDHDCVVEDFCHIFDAAHLSGTVVVGESAWVGVGATVSNNVNICGNSTIGAGAVVSRNIEEEGTYIGVPVKKLGKFNITRGENNLTHKNNTKPFDAIDWRVA